MTDNTGTQALWPQMISALAAIDRELGLPDDGCNSTAQTLNAIRLLKMAHRDDVKVATDLKGENAVLAGLLRDCDAVLATIEADDGEQNEQEERHQFGDRGDGVNEGCLLDSFQNQGMASMHQS